jgi:glycosyltransferase involved in cell wall biosynthesis
VIPVLNDPEGVSAVLAALQEQTLPPDEVVIVDGGSSDGTAEVIEAWCQHNSRSRMLGVTGVNVAGARNAGIRAASGDWIACTDAGCEPLPGWLQAIAESRDTGADFVAGVLLVDGQTAFQQALALTDYPSAGELDGTPTWVKLAHRVFGRRYEDDRVGGGYMAFSRRAWELAGGFPEETEAAEDRAFTAAVISAGLTVVRNPRAAVRWAPPDTWRKDARQFFRYARSDVRHAPRGRHALRATAWLAALAVLVRGGGLGMGLLSVAALAYLAVPLRRARLARLDARHWWRLPIAVVVKDTSQLAGAAAGLIDAARGRRGPR